MNFARIFHEVRLRYLMTVLAFLIGVFLPLQGAINNALKTDVDDSTLLAAGQIVASLLMDRVGFPGVPVRDISVVKLPGAVLPIAGMILVNFGVLFSPRA